MNPALIQEIITLIALAGEYGTELYLKLKAIGELGADEQANIHKQITDGIAFDQSVKDKYAQWRVDVGLDRAPAETGPATPVASEQSPTPPVPAVTEPAPETPPPAVVPIATPAPAPTPKVSTVNDSSSTIPPVEEPAPVAAVTAPAPAPTPKVSTVHDSSSTIPPSEEAPKAGSD